MKTVLVCLLTIMVVACSQFNYDKNIQSVVQIKEPTTKSHGTGFYIGENLIITAKHVVSADAQYYCIDNQNNTYEAQVVFRSETLDVAILSIKEGHNLVPVTFAEQICVGEVIHSIGFPLILEWTYSCGYVSGVNISFNKEWRARVKDEFIGNYFSTNMPVERGMSGGAVFNKQGKVIGMVNAMLTSGSFAWGMSLDTIKEALAQYKEKI